MTDQTVRAQVEALRKRPSQFNKMIDRETASCFWNAALDAVLRLLETPPQPTLVEDADVRLLAWAVVNCHTLARRALAHGTPDYREKWEHVLRICEKAGARSAGVLRASVPTELTEGETPPAPPADLSRVPRWRLLPNEPWMERSARGEYVRFDDVAREAQPATEEARARLLKRVLNAGAQLAAEVWSTYADSDRTRAMLIEWDAATDAWDATLAATKEPSA